MSKQMGLSQLRYINNTTRSILARTDLSGTEKIVAVVIAQHLNEETKDAWPSVSRVAELAGVSERTVIRTIKKLENLILTVKRRENLPSIYSFHSLTFCQKSTDRKSPKDDFNSNTVFSSNSVFIDLQEVSSSKMGEDENSLSLKKATKEQLQLLFPIAKKFCRSVTDFTLRKLYKLTNGLEINAKIVQECIHRIYNRLKPDVVAKYGRIDDFFAIFPDIYHTAFTSVKAGNKPGNEPPKKDSAPQVIGEKVDQEIVKEILENTDRSLVGKLASIGSKVTQAAAVG